MTATKARVSEYEVLVVERAPTTHVLRFTFGPHMVFDRVPAKVLYPETWFPEAVIEAEGREVGERITFLRSRRSALEEWFTTRYVEQ